MSILAMFVILKVIDWDYMKFIYVVMLKGGSKLSYFVNKLNDFKIFVKKIIFYSWDFKW